MHCKKPRCTGLVTPPGVRYCAECRRERRDRLAAYLATAGEVNRLRNRRNAGVYARSRTARALAYRERHRVTRARACRAWTKANPDRKRLIAALARAVAHGDIIRPSCCQDCCKDTGPIVAWGLADATDGSVQVEAWCCWGCWYKRKRGEGRA